MPATPSPAHARYYGYVPGIFGGLLAGALIAGMLQALTGMEGYGYYGSYYPITADTIPLTATDTLTRPDTPTTAVILITVAGIAVGIANNTA